MPRAIEKHNTYQKKLLKLLPSESVALYLTAINIIPSQDKFQGIHVVVLVVIAFLTPLYLVRLMDMDMKREWLQILFVTLSFVVWAFTINGEKWIGILDEYLFLKSLVLVVWTAIVPIFFKGEPA